MFYFFVCFIFYFLYFIFCVQSSPTRDFSIIYLTRFGYFDNGKSIQQLVDDGTLKNSLSQFQSSAGLEVTGNLNDDTLEMMNKPRCGFKDTLGTASDYRSKRYALQGSSWRRSNLKYKVSKYPRRIKKGDIDQEVARAFSEWSKHADLVFTPSTDQADIEIKFEKYEHGDENPFDGKGGVLAHANFPMNGGGVHFDASEDWGINSTDSDKKDFYRTAAHEIGHALGLGHSDVIQSLMAPFYKQSKASSLITDDDVQAIQALYGTKSEARMSNLNEHPQDTILCKDPKIDTIFKAANNDVYIFKGDKYWKVSQNGSIFGGYPKAISSNWKHLPTPVDAAFTHTNRKAYFFKGTKVWRYTSNITDVGYPKDISQVFPGIPDNVDAAFVWGGNGKLYFFKGSKFWKCNSYTGSCRVNGYPKHISHWTGVSDRVDAVFNSDSGYTYFFKNDVFYKFDDREFSVIESDPPYPRGTSKWWFGCKPLH